MKVNRGDVVVLDYPFSDGSGTKIRPALVVQSNEKNRRLTSTVVALITRNIARADTDPTHLFISLASPEGKQAGLRFDSVVTFTNFYTVHESLIRHRIGHLPSNFASQIDACLKSALGITNAD